jgi:hypothetical protein
MQPPLEKTWIDPRIEIRTSSIGGKGMFAIKLIKEGEKVAVWGGTWGKEYTDSEGAKKAKEVGKLIMQWDDNLYSVEERGNDTGYFINHSCDPNIWMQDAFTLIARRAIQPGEELTADYALWEADENHVAKWRCKCGSPLCRGGVTGKDWTSLIDVYRGHFSPLIEKRIRHSMLEKTH